MAGLFWSVCLGLAACAQMPAVNLAPLNPGFTRQITSQPGLKRPALGAFQGPALGLLPSPLDLSHLTGRAVSSRSLRAGLPASYDLRSLGKLTSVKNQNPYGTCWAFAAYGSLESCLAPAETNDFSENNLANLAGFDYGFNDGGNAEMATAYLARWAGPVNESDDSYPDPGHSPSGLLPVKHIQAVEIIGQRTSSTANDNIKQAVRDQGALFVSMCWASGAYNAATHSYYLASSAVANHAVAIVGWDDAYSSANFALTPAGNGAFIVKNSWGTGFGEDGYFYVSYYDAVFARDASYLFLNAAATDNYAQVYQYDPLGWVNSFGYDDQSDAWGANIFTVTNGGELSAVSFYATSTNAGYEVFIYSDVSSSQPCSGSLRADQAGALTNAGYYTIPLATPVALSAGELFSVVVKFTMPSYQYPIPVEYALGGYSSQATALPGQSFTSSNSATWEDTTAYDATMNVCIKAFMNTTVYPYSAPAGFSATAGAYFDQVRLTWSQVSDATGYAVYRGDASAVASAALLANTTALFYDDSSVTPGSRYYYRVKATGPSGSSDFSAMAYGCAQLTAPAGLSASQGADADEVRLSWDSASGATGYIVYRSLLSDSNAVAEAARASSAPYDDTSATPGTIYHYWVKAYASASTSSLSSSASGYRSLLVPGNVTASTGTCYTGVRVAWDNAAGASTYSVWRNTSVDYNSALDIGGTADDYFADASALPGALYYYWVQSKNGAITSSFSDYACGWWRNMAAGNNAQGDLDGDGIMDFAVYQESAGIWSARLSGRDYATFSCQLGGPGGCAATCDYDGDGQTDPTVYQESTGLWTTLLSGSDYRPEYAVLGGDGFVPVIGDYDGDGRADPAVYQEATGLWYALCSSQNYAQVTAVYGAPGYKPVAADYDGDGLVDLAIYYEPPGQGTGFWSAALSSHGYGSYYWITSGGAVPVPADYDGDGKADPAVYNAASGTWSYWSSASNYSLRILGALGGAQFTAVPADYDGDEKADAAVYQEAEGTWYLLLSAHDYAPASGELGGPGWEPVGARR